MQNSPVKFLKEVKAELKQVTWPTKKEVTRLTIIVIIICLVVGIYIGFLDFFLTKLIQVAVSH